MPKAAILNKLTRHYRIILICFFLLYRSAYIFGQVGGNSVYAFLNLPNSARVASLGGIVVSVPDHDPNLAFHNPGILTNTNSNQLLLNYVDYFSDISYGYVSYAQRAGSSGVVSGGVQYINYGSFIEADETGAITGSFKASEYAFNLMYARTLPFDSLFTVGINVKPVFSNFERYRSFGLAADLGIHYIHPGGLFSAGLVIRNAGFQLKSYDSNGSEPLPFEIQAGLSKKLKHAPFRLLFNVQHLEKFKLAAESENLNGDPNQNIFDTPENRSGPEKFGDNLLRHFVYGIEFVPAKSFSFRLGYNYLRRKELQIPTRVSTVGFSWGFGVQLRTFHLSYGRATYHLAGASNHFALQININEIYSRLSN